MRSKMCSRALSLLADDPRDPELCRLKDAMLVQELSCSGNQVCGLLEPARLVE